MTIVRAPFVDEYVEGDECVVMLTDGRVLALSPLATAALMSVNGGASDIEGVAEALTAIFGSPPGDPDGVATTSEIVRVLAASGLLTIDPP